MSNAIELTHAERLTDIVEALAVNDTTTAGRLIPALFQAIRDDEDPPAVGYAVFGAALARRLSGSADDEANLYLTRFDVPQIDLFNLLALEVPQVKLTTIIANRCIMQAISNHAHATIIDIGIGTGRQMVELLEVISAEGTLPQTLTLIGIEPSDSSLDLARENIQNVEQKLGIAIDFHPICSVVERLTPDDWDDLAARCATRPVINGSFALHHISDVDDRDVRDDVFARLRALEPLTFVLAEPNVHHVEPDFARRFANCWRHFGATFQVIDELAIAQRDKDALKVCFFGREIADILGNAEDSRSERHERTSSWLARLKHAGFEPCLDIELPPSDSVIDVTRRCGYATLDYRDLPLIAVIAATPVSRD